MTDLTEMVEWLTATVTGDLEKAKAATAGPWSYDSGKIWLDGEAFESFDRSKGEEYVAHGGPSPFTGCVAATGPADHPQSMADAEHIATHDPSDTIARCESDLALIDDLLSEKHVVVDGDCWFTCSAATEERDGGDTCNDERKGQPCDCGRDYRVERRLRLLIGAYRDRDGYKASWTA